MKWPKGELCQGCRSVLGRTSVYCLECGLTNQARVNQERAAKKQAKLERMKHQEYSFLQAFDKRAWELSIGTLRKGDKVTVTLVIEILSQDENLLAQWAKQERVALPTERRHLRYVQWIRRRVIRLGKWWAKNDVAFIGTETSQGHPYLFYLGKQPSLAFDPTIPSKSKARWSVKKIQAALHTPLSQEDQVPPILTPLADQ